MYLLARRALVAALLSMTLVSAASAEETRSAESIRAEATRAYQQKDYAACGAAFAKLASRGTARRSTDAHNAACCFALAGEADVAFSILTHAVDSGRDTLGLETDTDLASLRTDPRWPGLLARARAARERYVATIHAELARIHEEDQRDRVQPIDWSKVTPRDRAREARVKELIAAGAPKVADDYFHAAMIMQHGETPDDYKQARTLARKAVALDPGHSLARWLAAAAHDRYLWSINKPQIYGTQFHKIDGRWTIEPIDRTAITDAQRIRAGVPALAEAEQSARAMELRDSQARTAAPAPAAAPASPAASAPTTPATATPAAKPPATKTPAAQPAAPKSPAPKTPAARTPAAR